MNQAANIEKLTIKIAFTGYWASATGAPGSGDQDSFSYRDRDGCPALPMTLVKGMLRETAQRVWSQAKIAEWFGPSADLANDYRGTARLAFQGEARLGSAELAWFKAMPDHRRQLFTRIRSTSIGGEGVAETDTLRSAEVVVPLVLEGRIACSVSITRQELDELQQLACLTFAFGSGKQDGLGRAVVTIERAEIDLAEGGSKAKSLRASEGDCVVVDLIPETRAIFSRNNATDGEHETHPGPTGAALWGWAIAQLAGDKAALGALLRGEIHFSNAAPLPDGQNAGFPRPGVLFAPKQPESSAQSALNASGGFNPAAVKIGRPAYVAAHGDDLQANLVGKTLASRDLRRLGDPETGHRLRTAHVDGKAKDGALFGFEAVEPTVPRYQAVVVNSNAPPEVWAKLCSLFCSELRLGRSRNTMYGGSYRVEEAAKADNWPLNVVKVPAETETLRLWCLSDLRIEDNWGQLVTKPGPEDFGLDGDQWRLNPMECSVTTRRFAPWDREIGGHNREIGVVEAGSVFGFARQSPGEAYVKPRHGLFGERGFGWISVLPEWVSSAELPLRPEGPAEAEPREPKTDLVKWASSRSNQSRSRNRADRWARAVMAELSVGGAFLPALAGWPGPSQWGYLLASAAERKNAFGKSESGWTKVQGKIGGEWLCLGDWLGREFEALDGIPPNLARDAIKAVVDHAKRQLDQEVRHD